ARLMPWCLFLCLALLPLGGCGDDDEEAEGTQAPQLAAPPSASVCVGESHTCVMKASGEVLCTGMNLDGQLGDGTTLERHGFVPVVGLGDAKQLSCGAQHTCAVRATGAVACWGQNHHGELGDGGRDPHASPVEVAGLEGAVEV